MDPLRISNPDNITTVLLDLEEKIPKQISELDDLIT